MMHYSMICELACWRGDSWRGDSHIIDHHGSWHDFSYAEDVEGMEVRVVAAGCSQLDVAAANDDLI